ncbi:MAG: thioredoxin domain-containing protein [Proteobacteria bacterium]|nr:thioredoxin domain-containing protein [Pseudomonadota bacterium]
MASSSGGQTIAAAAILGLCVLGGAFLVSRSMEGTSEAVIAALDEMKTAVEKGSVAVPAPPPRQARRRGPDPDRVYKLNVKGSPAKGPEQAAVTLVEFSDFQCPYCARVTPTLQQIEKEYGDSVRIVFKHLPLSMHTKAPAAHAAAEAASRQGKFWEMHDKIFANQREMSEPKYVEWAGELGLDVEQFKKDVASDAVKGKVAADASEAAALGVSGTPAFFLNGKYHSGAKPYSEFKRLIDEAMEG